MTGSSERRAVDLRSAEQEIRALPAGADRRSISLASGTAVRLVLLRLRAGAALASHATSGPTTIHALEGRVTVGIDGVSVDLGAGQLVTLDVGDQHSVSAIEDSTLLLTIAAVG